MLLNPTLNKGVLRRKMILWGSSSEMPGYHRKGLWEPQHPLLTQPHPPQCLPGRARRVGTWQLRHRRPSTTCCDCPALSHKPVSRASQGHASVGLPASRGLCFCHLSPMASWSLTTMCVLDSKWFFCTVCRLSLGRSLQRF